VGLSDQAAMVVTENTFGREGDSPSVGATGAEIERMEQSDPC